MQRSDISKHSFHQDYKPCTAELSPSRGEPSTFCKLTCLWLRLAFSVLQGRTMGLCQSLAVSSWVVTNGGQPHASSEQSASQRNAPLDLHLNS